MDRKTLWVGVASIALIAIAGAATMLFSKPANFRGTTYAEPYPVAPEIELKQANGESFRLSDLKGKIALVFFGFTHCTDVCPITMAEMKLVLEDMGSQADSVQVVFITVDPDRDTPEIVQEYARRFHPSFIGLSGSTEELTKIWDEYGVFRGIVKSDSAHDYEVDHTARVTLIDPGGNLRLSYGYQTPAEDIVYDLKLLLK